jgi:hypothetical protein
VLRSEEASRAIDARGPGSETVPRLAAARGSASVLHSSARSRSRRIPWLAASVVWAAAACTLTDKSFEPARLDDAETQSETSLPGAPSAPDGLPLASQQSGLPATSTNAEAEPDVRPLLTQMNTLEPSDVSDGTAADAGVTQLVDVERDAGVVVEVVPPVVVPVVVPPVVAPPVVVPPVVVPPAELCTGLTLGASCYELFNSFLSWDAAEQQCVGWGGHLASIGSPEENAALDAWPAQLGLSTADGSGIWVGGTDAQSDGQFLWVDGSPFTLQGWAPGQPDNGAGIDCIEKRNDGAGQWYDRRCIDSLRYLCERPL